MKHTAFHCDCLCFKLWRSSRWTTQLSYYKLLQISQITLNDASAKDFLDRFPLPVILNALQTKADVPGLESTLIAALERVFQTKYGASLIPHYMPFIQVGLTAESHEVKSLACKTVTYLLENLNEGAISAVRLIVEHNIYPLLLDCLINGNERVATFSTDAIGKMASSPAGMDVVFPANTNEATHLGALAAQCSSLGRVRVLALIVKLFSISSYVASAIHRSNLLRLFEAEINNTNDTLATLSVLEIMYELSEVEHGREFLSTSTLLQLLSSIISNKSMESVLRSRAMMISGRLLSKGNYMFADELSVKTVVSAIDRILSSSETQDADECESALEALGEIGSWAQFLLSSSPPAARHVIYAAFDRQGRGKQLAALHALGNIFGETRSENSMILTSDAEESLRRLIYETASKSSKLTPSGYRMLTGLVARPWCLMEICSKQEIINIVTDATTETTKLGMEARYNCCKAIQKAFIMSSKVSSDPALAGLAEKLYDAVRKGPYLAKRLEAQPTVVTDDRF
ncbi:ARM repeat superfamily protein [Prunus dulcis]|uniref:ARM repeat superfamily protein n=1 Tax=Prunus dulcis TaxID=3755 RepID=A0A4Y1RBY9_PRUDU|nr:ARM repeat superfamily protein [Prunus dulcis]